MTRAGASTGALHVKPCQDGDEREISLKAGDIVAREVFFRLPRGEWCEFVLSWSEPIELEGEGVAYDFSATLEIEAIHLHGGVLRASQLVNGRRPTGSEAGAGAASTESADQELTLSSSSALIDFGDPDTLDTDGSISDIGAYGGPRAIG